MIKRFVFLLLATGAGTAFAEPFLDFPLDCALGETCFVEDYVDLRPGSGQNDYTCGIKARDGHRGTDFALLDFDAMANGVEVYAAADGAVVATRDGMADTPVTEETRASIMANGCGNAVSILHPNGYRSTYCHLRNGSVTVREGDAVQSGDVLGLVGLSGLTNFPHLHLSLVKDGQIVDPFAPASSPGKCGTKEESLWKTAIPYERSGLFTVAFSNRVPNFEAVQSGAARREKGRSDEPLVLYSHAFYAETGDILHLSAKGPEGEIFATDIEIERGRAQLFRAFGRKAPAGGWAAGLYTGTTRLTRNGRIIATRHTDIEIR